MPRLYGMCCAAATRVRRWRARSSHSCVRRRRRPLAALQESCPLSRRRRASFFYALWSTSARLRRRRPPRRRSRRFSSRWTPQPQRSPPLWLSCAERSTRRKRMAMQTPREGGVWSSCRLSAWACCLSPQQRPLAPRGRRSRPPQRVLCCMPLLPLLRSCRRAPARATGRCKRRQGRMSCWCARGPGQPNRLARFAPLGIWCLSVMHPTPAFSHPLSPCVHRHALGVWRHV